MPEFKKESAKPFRDMGRKIARFEGETRDIAECEREIEKLQVQVVSMEEDLRQGRLMRGQLDHAFRQNEKLAAALIEAKNKIEGLKAEVEKLSAPPSTYAIFSDANSDGTVNLSVAGRKMKVNVHPDISIRDLKRGQQVVLNEALNVVEAAGFDLQGEVGHIKNLLSESRVLMSLHGEEERVVELAEPLKDLKLSIGDPLLFDSRSGYALERLPKSEVEDMILEEVPDATYDDIGGLAEQIEAVRDAVELPFLHPELFAEHRLSPPKGVLLYGPPGCGKTLIAKAVAASLAKKLGHRDGKEIRSFFMSVKGPELLNKYVGETERKIREIFKKARERAEEGHPVIIFFDEMDALFRTRGTGVSSDMEATVVPQFLAEIDGLEVMRNVIVIGASNRQDLLDPAILRAGRLDVKIKIERPDRQGAVDIFQKYLSIELPYDEALIRDAEGDRRRAIDRLIADAVDEMYSTKDENQFLEVSYANGEKEVLYFKDFSSGAMVSGIVSRAKKYAIKRTIETGERGIKLSDIIQAIRDEYRENEDLPNTTNPDDWAKIAGRRGDKIVHVRTIAGSGREDDAKIEAVPTGHYL
jgi:proteasome-associated ATPase